LDTEVFKEDLMNTTVTRLLIGIALTAGITYLLDPTSGRRRRATVREQVGKAAHKLNDGTRATRADLADRAQRLAGQCKSQAKSLAGQAKSMAGSVAGQAKSFVKPDLRATTSSLRARVPRCGSLSDCSAMIAAVKSSSSTRVSPQTRDSAGAPARQGSREVMIT
jgi:hypothetical protein